jgi:hypothetical protein
MASKNDFLKSMDNARYTTTYKQWSKANKKYNKKNPTKTGNARYTTTAEEYAQIEKKRETDRWLDEQKRRQHEKRRQQEALHQQQIALGNELTAGWKERAANAADAKSTSGIGTSFKTYQEKMKADAGGTSYQEKRQQKKPNTNLKELQISENTARWRQYDQDTKQAGFEGIGYAAKKINDTASKGKVLADKLNKQFDRDYRGNIDLNNRPVVKNPDGSISTERSITVGFDDGVYLLPTVVNGKIVSEKEAINHFLKTGEHLGRFNSEEEVGDYPVKLHERQERYYGTSQETGKEKLNNLISSMAERRIKQATGSADLTPEQKEQIEKYQKAEDLRTANIGDTRFLGGRTDRTKEILSAGNAPEMRAIFDTYAEQGAYDQFGDPRLMTEQGRQKWKNKYEQDTATYEQQAKDIHERSRAAYEKPINDRFGALVDLISTPEIDNERRILSGDGYTAEEKANAQAQLSMMLESGNWTRAMAETMDRLTDADTAAYTGDELRRIAYDTLNGDGEYDFAVSRMNAAQKDELDEKIDQAIQYARENNYGRLQRNAESMAAWSKQQAKAITAAEERQKKYDQLMAGEIEVDPTWDPNYLNYQAEYENMALNGRREYKQANNSGVDTVYAYLGGIGFNPNDDLTSIPYAGALLMNKAERDKFTSLYKAGKKNEAWAFYQGLEQAALNPLLNYYETMGQRETARRIPVSSSAATLGAHIVQPVEFMANLPDRIKALTTGESNGATDPYGHNYTATRMKQNVREFVASDLDEAWGKGWGKRYQGIMSGLDSGLNVALAKGMGFTSMKAVQNASLALFTTQAFETSLQNSMANGADPFGYNYVEAWIDAAIETATEIVSVGAWLKKPKNLLTFVAHMFIEEPSEEIAGAVVEPYVKLLMGHANQWENRAQEILAAGGYTDDKGNFIPVKNEDEATRQAMKEWNHEIYDAAVQAAWSIGPSAVYQGGMLHRQTRLLGKSMQRTNVNGEQSAAKQLAEAGAKMDQDSYTYKLSQKMNEKLAEGKKVSNYDIGLLTRNMMEEANENAGRKAQNVLRGRIFDDLEGKDLQGAETKAMDRDVAADLLTRAIVKGIDNLSQKERDAIHYNNDLYNVYKTYRYNEELQKEIGKEQENETAAERKAMSTAQRTMIEAELLDTEAAGKIQLADEEEWKNAEGDETTGSRRIIYDGKRAKLGNLIETKENGKTVLRYQVKVDGQEEPVLASADQIRAITPGTAGIVYLQSINKGFYSGMYTNRMLAMMDDKRIQNKPDTLMKDAKSIRIAAMTQAELPQTELPTDVAEELYNAAKAEFIMLRQKDVQNKTAQTPGEGKIIYKGKMIDTETDEFSKALEGLDDNTRQYVKDLSDLARAMGVNLNIRDNSDITKELNSETEAFKNEPQKIYGFESRTGITVNIEGMDYQDGKESGRHNIGITFGHETVHWLQRNSMEGYNNLLRYVMDAQRQALGEKGLQDKIEYVMRTQNLDLDHAISEIVAESCDNIFNNEEVVKHIQQTNETLYKGLRGFAKDLMNRVKTFMRGHERSMSKYSKNMLNEQMREIGRLYNLAWDEAISGKLKVNEKEAEKAKRLYDKYAGSMSEQELAKLSSAQMDDEYMAAVESGNVQRKNELVEAAAKKAGYTIKAYHGTPNGKFNVFEKYKVGTSTDFGKLGRGFYFTAKKEVADYYAGYLNSSTVMPVYLKLNNPFVLDSNYDNMTVREMYDSILGEGGPVDEYRSEELTKWLIDNGYDGIIADDEYMVLDSENIKSADPVTYDDEGNVIPLSERFSGDADIRYSFADMQEKTWDEQIEHMLSNKAKTNDVMELAKTDELNKLSIKVPISLRKSVLTKMMRDPGMTKRSGHKMTKTDVLNVKNEILQPAAKITRGNTVYIVTNDLDNENRPVVFVGEYANEFIKGGTLDTKTIHRRNSISTLFGKFVDGEFIPYADAKIWKYNENADNILSLSPVQFQAGKDVINVINTLTQNEQNSNTEKALEQDLSENNGPETHYGDHERFSQAVTDKDELDFLNNQKTVKTYRSMQLIDGKLYPPMAAVVAGSLEDATELGKWEKAVEHPELIKVDAKGKTQFNLNKGKGKGSLYAAYNPYMHSSNLMINDQFTGAYDRPNLVTVECEVPVSELDSGYHAEFAKDSVGWHSWHAGPVAGQLRNVKGIERQVFLSRWIKPVRIVDNAEVAQHYADLLNGTDIAVPDNVVTPQLLEELKKAGVKIQESGRLKADTRFSTAQQDQTETEQFKKWFGNSKVVNADGTPKIMYHGTRAQFSVFDTTKAKAAGTWGKGFYFTNEPSHAGQYGDQMAVYLRAENPLTGDGHEITKEQMVKFLQAVAEDEDYGLDNYGQDATPESVADDIYSGKGDLLLLNDVNSTAIGNFKAALDLFNKVNGTNYDSVITDLETVVYKPNQVKSATENNGDYSLTNDDIYYSTAPVEETRDLIAYHNLGADQLMKVLQLGGFAMPSIGITRDNYINDRYGDITVVFHKNTIDPRANRANKVYGGDAWTPVYPSVEYKLNEKKLDAINKKVNDLVPEQYRVRNVDLYAENLENKVNSRRGNIVEAVKDNVNLMAAYLTEKGKKINYPTRDVSLDGFGRFSNEQILSLLDVIDENTIREAFDGGYSYLREHPELVEQIRQALNAQWKQKLQEKLNGEKPLKIMERELYSQEKWGPSYADNAIRAANKYLNSGIQQELDQYALKDMLTEQIDQADYENWLAKTFDGVIEKKGIRNKKDLFTNSGNMRSWDQLHDEETLENVVNIMKAEADKGATGFFSQSEILALGTKDYRNISEIRADKGRLQHISDEEMSAAKADIVNRFGVLVDQLVNKKADNPYIERDNVLSAIVDAIRSNKTAAGIQRMMNSWRYNLTDAQAQEIVDLMKEISELPTEYFEAKPQRAVGMDEVAFVLVPEGTDQALLDALDREGIEYETYDGTTEDRLAKMNAHDDVKFSTFTDEQMDVDVWMMNATPSSVQTEDERQLLQAYRGLKVSMNLCLHRIVGYQQKIKALEEHADRLTPAERDDLIELRNKVAKQQQKMAEYENELFEITSQEGYARKLYQFNIAHKNFLAGKTAEQVRQAVEDMLAEVQKAQEQIRKDTEDLKALAQEQAVKTMRSFLGKSSLGDMAAMLRKAFDSNMNKAEVQDRLAEISIKMAAGKDVNSDIELLTQDLMDKVRGYRSDNLEYIRGTTLVIGQHLVNELKAEHVTLKELRSALKGSGVTLKTAENGRFVQTWEELRGNNQALPEVNNLSESDAIRTIIDYIENEMRSSRGAEQFGGNFDELALLVRSAATNVTTFITGDAAARKQITSLMKQIQDLSSKTEKTAADMDELDRQMDAVIKTGHTATAYAGSLSMDVNSAIEYYNKTARVAAEKERTKVRKQLIEQLRSENTKRLIEQQEEFKKKLEKDRTARQLAQDNLVLRRRITTVAKRMANLITKETDIKNIPEQAKPLARQMLRMLVNHDRSFRMVMFGDRAGLNRIEKVLDILDTRDGKFKDEDLDWLIRGEGENADYDMYDRVITDLINIETGLLEYASAEGKGNVSLMDRKNALTKVQKAVTEIYSVIKHQQEVEIEGRKWNVDTLAMQLRNDMRNSRFKGNRWFGSGAAGARAFVIAGNTTPEYFIKNLHNGTMTYLFGDYHNAENRAGLLYQMAADAMNSFAEEAGFDTWDPNKKFTITLEKGGTVKLNVEQMMQIYATWKREQTLQAEIGSINKTFHLESEGFYVENDEHKIGQREVFKEKSYRMTENDFAVISKALTQEQKEYVDKVVEFLTRTMGAIGNEASMRMYGIRKYNEQYYFPFEVWSGVKSIRSDKGAAGSLESHRGAHPSFSKRLMNNAGNALVMRGFTQTAAKHIVGMINYGTFAPAIENLQKVMNVQVLKGETAEDMTLVNMWTEFGEAYGKDAMNYLLNFQKAINNGADRNETTPYDRLLRTFRKSAVAGSLSVAFQQPLSYIRAIMEIDPKYLAQAIVKQQGVKNTKAIVEEMRKYSGVAVLKKMGKFDMGFGRSAQQFVTPEGLKSKAQKAYDYVSDKTTALPELMDTVTWTRLWLAAKLEQQALHKDMDVNSDAFLQMVADRFNEIIRMTQVYDSVMVRSPNMRSTNPWVKGMTSFMAEPTLTMNVLADAVVNAKDSGGKTRLAKACAAYILSAVGQALVKGLMGAGRNPDKKKTWDENAAYRFMYNFIGEINPLGLLPGYSDIITLIKEGELTDDAMNVIGKIFQAGKKGLRLMKGSSENVWRDVEDSVGVVAQMFTNIPVKNLSRDARAMINFFTQPYAQRPNSAGVLKYQTKDLIFSADNLLGALNKLTGDAIYKTTNSAYYDRIYQAEKTGDTKAAEEMKDYVTLTSSAQDPEKNLNEALRSMAKKDADLSGKEKVQAMLDNGGTAQSIKTWITKEYKAKYVAASVDERRRMMNELTAMYKMIGVDGEAAMKIVAGWVKESKKESK